MKKLITVLLCICFTMTLAAQNEKGQFSIKPMAGVNFSTIAGSDDIYKYRVGFTAGAEVEYGISRVIGVSLGALYSQQGGKADGSYSKKIVHDDYEITQNAVWVTGKLHSSYINVPVMVNFYIPSFECFTLKIGAQVGVNLNNKLNLRLESDTYKFYDDRASNPSQESSDDRHRVSEIGSNDACKTIDFGIPVGIAYEYKGYSLDLRYYFGLSNIKKLYDLGDIRNRYLSITLGYRLKL